MSKFLGPFHYWLYNKIQLQEELISRIEKVNGEKNWVSGIAQTIDQAYGVVPREPLEQIIDEGNIHGWLQGQITVSERRFARLVTEILQEDPSRLDVLKDLAFNYGKEKALPADTNAVGAFQAMNDEFLDGMPCDMVNQPLSKEPDHVEWVRRRDIHASYWDDVNGDVNAFHELRKKMFEGMLEGTNLKFEETAEGQFQINQK